MNPHAGEVTADLGCGLGFDAMRLARLVAPRGRAIGVDSSIAFLESARLMARHCAGLELINADIQNLPFPNGSLHSCKVDRTLQHIEQPSAVLQEMFRTVRSGGVVVCAEPDWGTFTIDHENRPMVQNIAEFWAESFRNPWIGRQLRNELRKAGFIDIQVQGALLVAPSFEASDQVFDIVQTALRLAETTRNDEPIRWLSSVKDRDLGEPGMVVCNPFPERRTKTLGAHHHVSFCECLLVLVLHRQALLLSRETLFDATVRDQPEQRSYHEHRVGHPR